MKTPITLRYLIALARDCLKVWLFTSILLHYFYDATPDKATWLAWILVAYTSLIQSEDTPE